MPTRTGSRRCRAGCARRCRPRRPRRRPISRPSTGAACRRSPTRCRAARRSAWRPDLRHRRGNRLAFGVIDATGEFVYGKTAVYIAPTPDAPAQGPSRRPPTCSSPTRRSARAGRHETDLFAASTRRRQVLQARQLDADDRDPVGGGLLAAPSQVKVVKPGKDDIPQVGEAARAWRPTRSPPPRATRSRSTRASRPRPNCTRTFADVVGKKPVALLFATPQLCQSRVCGPVTDIALQLKAKYGDQMDLHPPGGLQGQRPQQGPPQAAAAVQPQVRAVAVRRRQPTARSPSGSRARSG